jgi:hypothetical protein
MRTLTAENQKLTGLVLGPVLQRKCDCGQHTIAGGECSECSKKHELPLQRLAINHSRQDGSPGVPPIVHEVLKSPGQPLDADTRAFFEPRFGRDFSNVRVHADAHAAESARSVHALAYTVGQDLVFGRQQYLPQTVAGRRLIAHELTHVVQQGFQRSSSATAVSQKDNGQEREADTIADAINSAGTVSTPASHARGLLQRSNGDEDSDRSRSRQSKPRDAPRGTKPIDQTGLDKDDVHKIKKGVGAAGPDWVGVTPDGEVITSDGEGNAENHGPASDYIREAHPEIPSWVWTLVGIVVVAGIIACFATGVCELAAIVAGLGYATALLIMGLLRGAGIRDSGTGTAANEPDSSSPDDVA